MGASTIYDIRLRYLMEDRATRGTQKLTEATDRAARSSGGLQKALGLVGGAITTYFGARMAGKALIGFNADLEQAKITMAGMLQLNMGGEWASNMAYATRLVSDFQQIAKQSVGTTKDFVDMASLITRPVVAAGASMSDLRDITKGAVIAAKAFGIQAEVAALDVEQALMGGLTKRERFARALLEPAGFTTESFNALDPKKRLEELAKALRGPAVQAMAKAQEKSFAGVLSTFQDNLQMAFGRVGLPLMKAISAEFDRWNAWLDKHPKTLEEMGKKLSDGLITAFTVIKDVATFFYDHADLLLTVAKAWAGLKIGRMAGDLLGGAAGAGGSFLQAVGAKLLERNVDSMGVKAASFGASLLNASSALLKFSPAIGLAIGAFEGLWSWWRGKKDAETEEELRLKGGVKTVLKDFLQSAPDRAQRVKAIVNSGGAEGALAAGLKATDIELAVGKVLSRGSLSTRQAVEESGLATFQHGGSSSDQLKAELAQQSLKEMDQQWQSARASLAKFAIEENLLLQRNGEWMTDSNKLQLTVRDRLGLTTGEFNKFSTALRLLELDLQRGTVNARELLGLAKMNEEAGQVTPFGERDPVGAAAAKPKVNIIINRIEVQSDDPDRFAFGLVESFRDAAKNPSSAVDAFREG
jgi:hypothetical protein